MKRLLTGIFAALVSVAAFGTTLNPVQLLNPAGSSSGQAIVSTGSSSAPVWGGIGVNGIAAIAANAVLANATGSSAAPTAFAMPSCSTSASALNWTSGTGFTCSAAILGGTNPGAFTTLSSSGIASLGTSSTVAASPAQGDSTGKIATTFYVQNALNATQGAAFTTLAASGNDALFYQTTNAQSFTSGTAATVTTWTKVFDRVNTNFNAATGVFTAPATGIYHVAAQLTFSANTGAIATVGQVFIVANGVLVTANNFVRQTTTSTIMNCLATADVSLTAGQTIVIQGSQNTGGAVTLNGTALVNYLSIHRVP